LFVCGARGAARPDARRAAPDRGKSIRWSRPKNRRHILPAAAILSAPALALRPLPSSPAPFANVFQGGAPYHITPAQEAQRVTASPAPAGRWVARADMPIPRSEMAWATARGGRMQVGGGHGEGRSNRAFHTVSNPETNRWHDAVPLPRGTNHVAVVADAGKVHAMGGSVEQNRVCDDFAFAYHIEADRRSEITRIPRPRGAAAATMLDGKVHLMGSATDPGDERTSIGWQEVQDSATNRWERRRPLPAARDQFGCVTFNGRIHVIGGRFNSFQYNTDRHHMYLPARDTGERLAPLPTSCSGHGVVIQPDRFFMTGGKSGIIERVVARDARVLGQRESYDPATSTWASHAPMPTPRHAAPAWCQVA